MTSPTYVSWACYNKASQAETNLANEQAQFYGTLTQDYATQYANQQQLLAQLNSVWGPILQAGPGQYGFTPQEDTSLRTTANDSLAGNYTAAQKNLNNTLASEGGGNTFIPSGGQAQLQAELQTAQANAQSGEQNTITQEGYQQGLQNFENASNALSGNAAQDNPLGYANSNISAGNSAFNSASTIEQQNSGWINSVAGLLGGAASSALGNAVSNTGLGVPSVFGA